MIRALFRLLSMIALAVAVIMAVLDATRSIAAETLVMTPLRDSWESLSAATFEQTRQMITRNLPDVVWDPLMLWLLALPGFAVFAGLALLFALAGHRPARRAGRFVPGR